MNRIIVDPRHIHRGDMIAYSLLLASAGLDTPVILRETPEQADRDDQNTLIVADLKGTDLTNKVLQMQTPGTQRPNAQKGGKSQRQGQQGQQGSMPQQQERCSTLAAVLEYLKLGDFATECSKWVPSMIAVELGMGPAVTEEVQLATFSPNDRYMCIQFRRNPELALSSAEGGWLRTSMYSLGMYYTKLWNEFNATMQQLDSCNITQPVAGINMLDATAVNSELSFENAVAAFSVRKKATLAIVVAKGHNGVGFQLIRHNGASRINFAKLQGRPGIQIVSPDKALFTPPDGQQANINELVTAAID